MRGWTLLVFSFLSVLHTLLIKVLWLITRWVLFLETLCLLFTLLGTTRDRMVELYQRSVVVLFTLTSVLDFLRDSTLQQRSSTLCFRRSQVSFFMAFRRSQVSSFMVFRLLTCPDLGTSRHLPEGVHKSFTTSHVCTGLLWVPVSFLVGFLKGHSDLVEY